MRGIGGVIEIGAPAARSTPALNVAGGHVFRSGALAAAALGVLRQRSTQGLPPAPGLSLPDLLVLYRRHGPRFAAHIGGRFTLVLHDGERRCAYVLQDTASSPLNLYYAVGDGLFYFDTSLKRLLRRSGLPRRPDAAGREAFLHNGFIPSERTLLEGVSKLTPGWGLRLDLATARIHRLHVPGPARRRGLPAAMLDYHRALRRVIRDEVADVARLGVVLSGGYDSNLLLFLLRQATRRRSKLLTIGARGEADEVPHAARIARGYPGLEHCVGRVGPHTLQRLPDIVWRLEGAVYERGIFLQYELARMARREGCGALLCAECADQVLAPGFCPGAPPRPVRLGWTTHPYEMGLMLVLKKNGILCNSFAVDTLYPYLDEGIVERGARLAPLNGRRKALHRLWVHLHLPWSLAARLRKAPGTTRLQPLFQSEARFAALRRVLAEQPGGSVLEPRYGNPDYPPDERARDLLLKGLYLRLFDMLIASGAYDAFFDAPGFEASLDDILARGVSRDQSPLCPALRP